MASFLLDEDKKRDGLNLNPALKQVTIPDKERHKEILNDMVKAFFQQRTGCDTERKTEQVCRGILDQCLTGFKRDGSLWQNAPWSDNDDWYETLSKRLRVMRYDIATNRIIPGRVKKKVSAELVEIKKEIKRPRTAKVEGEFDNREFSLSEEQDMTRFKDKFKDDFPSAITSVDEMMMDRLAFLMVLNKRDINEMDLSKDLTKEINELAMTLGVAGKQREAEMGREKTGTLEQLTTRYLRTLNEHIEVESDMKLEELKMISNAIHRGTTEEFLAMSWLKILYGSDLEGEPLSLKALDKFLKKKNIDVAG